MMKVVWVLVSFSVSAFFVTLGRAALTFDPTNGKQFNNTGEGFTGPPIDCDLQCQRDQRLALARLFEATNGEYWQYNQGWVDGDITSHCGWYGVHCCTDENTIVIKYITVEGWTVTYGNSAESFGQYCPVTRGVAALTLSLNNLTGTLPYDVFTYFTESLQYLDFHGNGIRGEIPYSIGGLTALKELSLNSNMFHGSIPPSIGQLHQLIALNLAVNQLSGILPVSLGELKDVRWMILNDNFLTGPVPFFVFGVRSLKVINLTNNKLSGNITDVRLAFVDIEIPYLLSGFNIEELKMRNNEIEGTIPSTITSLPLTVMDLGGNKFSGQIPLTIARSPFLRTLLLDNNDLSGPIPEYISKWNLENLDVSNNHLTGTVPEGLAIRTLRSLNLANNSLSGELPDAFKSMDRLYSLDISSNEDMMHTTLNSRDERLPDYLHFNTLGQFPQVDSFGRSRKMNCPQPMGDRTFFSSTKDESFKKVEISPEYYGFQRCDCADQKVFKRVEVIKDGVTVSLTCIRKNEEGDATPWSLIITPIVLIGIMMPLALWTWFRYRVTLARIQMTLIKRKGPPGTDREVTLVLTDVEGSTELWEWDTEIMAEAIDTHDRVMRSQLSKFFGYEITTEGDAFLVAFHEPMDALAWCLSLQYTLLGAPWPVELMKHKKAAVETRHTLESALLQKYENGGIKAYDHDDYRPPFPLTANESTLLAKLEQSAGDHQTLIAGLRGLGVYFRGLRVRMGIATGVPESMRVHKMTMRSEYFGDVVRRAQAVSDTPHGGQVLMDQETFATVNSRLDELGAMVNEAILSSKGLAERKKKGWFWRLFGKRDKSKVGCDFMPEDSEAGMDETLDGYDTQRLGPEGSVTSRFGTQETDVAIAGTEVKENEPSRGSKGKKRYKGWRRMSTASAVTVIDMGVHKLKGITQPNNLIQVVIPGLEERARFFPPLDSETQMSPGYFDAPATKLTPLDGSRPWGNLGIPSVTLVFCTIERFTDMQAFDKLAAEEALTIYNDCIRRTLLAAGGYECQEQEGSYMISFTTATAAVEWCLLVQEVLMEIDWTGDVLKLPGTAEEYNHLGFPVFRGPRVKMGIYEGLPTRAVPHSTTGRADYFGQFVNRAARFCHAAARGGQVIASRQVMENIVSNWRGVDTSGLCEKTPIQCTILIDNKGFQRAALTWKAGNTCGISASLFPKVSVLPVDDTNTVQRKNVLRAVALGEGQEIEGAREMEINEARPFAAIKGGLKKLKAPNAESPCPGDESAFTESFTTAGVEEPKYMSSFSVSSRLKTRWWSWVEKLEVEDLGSYRFKGVSGLHRIVSIKSQRLIGRQFAGGIRQGKGEKVDGGTGIVYSIQLVDQTSTTTSVVGSPERSTREGVEGSPAAEILCTKTGKKNLLPLKRNKTRRKSALVDESQRVLLHSYDTPAAGALRASRSGSGSPVLAGVLPQSGSESRSEVGS